MGCGPAGLLAAHAAEQLGYEVGILSVKNPSHISGAQVLHRPVNGYTDDSKKFQIGFLMDGLGDEYAKRIYGEGSWQGQSSWVNYQDQQLIDAWPIRDSYEAAYMRWQDRIENFAILGVSNRDLPVDPDDIVISSVPRFLLHGMSSPDPEIFSSVTVWIQQQLEDPVADNDLKWLVADCLEENTIWYNGTRDDGLANVYRASNIQGVLSEEYVRKPEGGKAVKVVKPIRVERSFLLDELPKNFLLVGRYGRWDKKQLAHHAYTDTVKFLADFL